MGWLNKESEAELPVEEMISNLRNNQAVTRRWAENLAELGAKGVDEGLLQSRDAGPKMAGVVEELANSSGSQLKRLSETFAKGGETAAEAFNTSYGRAVSTPIGNVVNQSKATAAVQVQQANFDSVGANRVTTETDQHKLTRHRA